MKLTFAGAQEAALLLRVDTGDDKTSSSTTKRTEYHNNVNSDRNTISCNGVGSSHKHANLDIYLAKQDT